MKYTAPSFTVPTGHRPADSCSHGWLDVRGRCVFCGYSAQDAITRQYLASHRAAGTNVRAANLLGLEMYGEQPPAEPRP